MRGILVGFDGSGHSTEALEWAAREAGYRKLPLTVLTVHQLVADYAAALAGSPGRAVAYTGDPELAERTRQEVQLEVDKVIGELGQDSRPTSVSVAAASGLPADELLNAGADADMIVVGSRGAGGFRKLLLGSVASQVTHHAQVPVVVVPSEST